MDGSFQNCFTPEEAQRLIAELTKRVVAGVALDSDALTEVLNLCEIGSVHQLALAELECWKMLLEGAWQDRDAAKTKLQGRGVPEFSAVLAVDAVSGKGRKRLLVEPVSIEFGRLRPGEGASATLTVTGGAIRVVSGNDRVKTSVYEKDGNTRLVRVAVSGGRSGEVLDDVVVVHGQGTEQKVPVRAQWQVPPPLPLVVTPARIDLGVVKLWQPVSAQIAVSANPVKVRTQDNRVKIKLLPLGPGRTIVEVRADPDAQEPILSNIFIRCQESEIAVPIRVRWEAPPLLQLCRLCGKQSLFWNYHDKKFECLNLKCKAEGPYPAKLVTLVCGVGIRGA